MRLLVNLKAEPLVSVNLFSETLTKASLMCRPLVHSKIYAQLAGSNVDMSYDSLTEEYDSLNVPYDAS